MKAAIYYGPRDIRVEEIEPPSVGENDVLIRVGACGICGSDLHTYRFGIFQDLGKPIFGGEGRVMGHEYAGEVTQVGSAVVGVTPGTRVLSVGPGAYAEFTVVNAAERPVIPLPDHVSFEVAATLEPLATSIHGVARTAPGDGETIVVLGAGIIGLGCVQVLKATSAARIIVVDGSLPRLEMARRLGADEIVDFTKGSPVEQIIDLTGGPPPIPRLGYRSGQADAVIDCAGAVNSTQQGIEMLKQEDGRLVLIALSEQEGPIDRNQIVRKQIDFRGSWGSSPADLRQALELVATGQIDRRPLISLEFALADAAEAFRVQERGEAIKVLVKP